MAEKTPQINNSPNRVDKSEDEIPTITSSTTCLYLQETKLYRDTQFKIKSLQIVFTGLSYYYY